MELFSLLVRRIPVQSAGNFSVWTAITSSMNLSMRVPAAQQQWRPKSCKTTRASHSTSRKKKHALTGEAWARTSSPVHPEFPGKTCVTSTISLVSSIFCLFGMWNGLKFELSTWKEPLTGTFCSSVGKIDAVPTMLEYSGIAFSLVARLHGNICLKTNRVTKVMLKYHEIHPEPAGHAIFEFGQQKLRNRKIRCLIG